MAQHTGIPAWRRVLSSLYYYSTCWGRNWYCRRLAAAGRAPLAVLTFHRVCDDRANCWTTPTASFTRTIHWLKDHFDLISLAELQQRMRSGRNERPAVSITFDDGYAANSQTAIPLLIAQGIPCTYFVTNCAVLEGVPLEHDTQMGNRLALNTADELRAMSRAGIEIGSHTRTHADLGQLLDPERLVDELVTSRDELAQAVGQPIRYFAFPFGKPWNLSTLVFQLARAAGYAGVCSAYGGWNYPGNDPFHIRRRAADGTTTGSKNSSIVDPLREAFLPRFTTPAATLIPPPLRAALEAAVRPGHYNSGYGPARE